jgi:hypothetical protein
MVTPCIVKTWLYRSALGAGDGELRADQERLEPAHQQEEEGRGAVHDADLLVVHGGEPRLPAVGGRRAREHAERLRDGRGAGGELERGALFDKCHVVVLLVLLRPAYFSVTR